MPLNIAKTWKNWNIESTQQLKEQYTLLPSEAEAAKLLKELNSKLAQKVLQLRERLNLLKTPLSAETVDVEADSSALEASDKHPRHPNPNSLATVYRIFWLLDACKSQENGLFPHKVLTTPVYFIAKNWLLCS